MPEIARILTQRYMSFLEGDEAIHPGTSSLSITPHVKTPIEENKNLPTQLQVTVTP